MVKNSKDDMNITVGFLETGSDGTGSESQFCSSNG
jgi:hypothetical protein